MSYLANSNLDWSLWKHLVDLIDKEKFVSPQATSPFMIEPLCVPFLTKAQWLIYIAGLGPIRLRISVPIMGTVMIKDPDQNMSESTQWK